MKRVIPNSSFISIFKYEIFTQAVKYFIVGGLCTIVDVGLLYALTQFLGINYLISSVISFMSGAVLNYFLCTIWIFKTRVVINRVLEFLFYIIITAVGLGINTLIIWLLTDFFYFHYLLSKIGAIFFTYWWNFGARKYFLHTIK